MVETKSKKPTEWLSEDHIEVVAQLNRLKSAGGKLTGISGTAAEEARRDISEVAAFLASELELHLRKEEEALFPSLEAVTGAGGGPTTVMLYEHEDLRAKNQELQGFVAGFGDAEKTARNVQKLQGTISYIYEVLTQHIHKEDYILFPMAEDALTPEAMEQVAAKMRDIHAQR